MKAFRLSWVCLTGTGLGQWKWVDEYFDTEEQARAVYDGFGPRPRAWWNLHFMRKVNEIGLCANVAPWQERARKEAVAELGKAKGVAA